METFIPNSLYFQGWSLSVAAIEICNKNKKVKISLIRRDQTSDI